MSNYNLKAAFTSFVKSGAYLARDLVPLDDITDSRVDRWRSSAMFLVRVGKRLFKEIDERDATIESLNLEIKYQKKELNDYLTWDKEDKATIEEMRGLLVLAAMNLETYRVLVNLNINADISSQVKVDNKISDYLNAK